MINNLKIFGFRFVIIFVIGFVLTLSFPFYFLPNIGKFIFPFFEYCNQFWASFLHLNESAYLKVISDSTGLYLHLITLLIISLTGSLFWSVFQKNSKNAKLKKWVYIGVSYYLALILFKYGFDKVFKHQFYLPEPNTLYTPMGDLSKDILFWSTMGSSYSYSVFSGLIEVFPAVLLLFRKTRLIGGLIAMVVMINVVMLNFGFDVSVKIFSLFLLGLTLIVISPYRRALIIFFSGQKPIQLNLECHNFKKKKQLIIYAVVKSVIIGLILFESLGGYFETNNFNDDNFPRPYLHGAYTNVIPNQSIKRVFFHRKQFFIIQNQQDKFMSYGLQFSEDLTQLILTDYEGGHFVLKYKVNTDNDISIQGVLQQDTINVTTKKENLKDLPLLKNNSFNWSFD